MNNTQTIYWHYTSGAFVNSILSDGIYPSEDDYTMSGITWFTKANQVDRTSTAFRNLVIATDPHVRTLLSQQAIEALRPYRVGVNDNSLMTMNDMLNDDAELHSIYASETFDENPDNWFWTNALVEADDITIVQRMNDEGIWETVDKSVSTSDLFEPSELIHPAVFDLSGSIDTASTIIRVMKGYCEEWFADGEQLVLSKDKIFFNPDLITQELVDALEDTGYFWFGASLLEVTEATAIVAAFNNTTMEWASDFLEDCGFNAEAEMIA